MDASLPASKIRQLLQKEYGLETFPPVPIRVKGFTRENMAEIISMLGLKKGAEIGVKRGINAARMCQRILDVELLCVDIWEGRTKPDYKIAVRRLSDYPTTIIRKTSMEAAREIPDGSLDFVYIDANHFFDYFMEDLITWARKVRLGGIVSGHDYSKHHREGVVLGVNTYVRAHRIQEWFLTGQKRQNSFFWVKE